MQNKIMSKFFPGIFLLLMLSISAFGQSVDIHVDGYGFFDNREYKAFTPRSKTYSGTRLSLDAGLNIDSANHFRVGMNALHEFGGKDFFYEVKPVIYYSYDRQGWLFNIGMFPRQNLVSDYPIALLNDTLNYYKPNIEGMLARYQGKKGNISLWIDWISRQTETAREQFIFGTSGKYIPFENKGVFVSHYFMMLHDAAASVPDPERPLQDNGAAQVTIGVDLSRNTAFDSLTIEAGGLLSLERVRGISGFSKPVGFVAAMHLTHKNFSVTDRLYIGEGHHIIYGDSFYTKKAYNRLDLSWAPFLFNNIEGRFIFSFHQSPGNWGDNQQAFSLRYNIGRKTLYNANK